MALRDWSEGRKAAAFGGALAVAVTVLMWGGYALNRTDVAGVAGPIDVRVRIDGSSPTIWYNATTRNTTAFSVLLEAAAVRGFSVTWSTWGPPLEAVFVESIAGDTNGASGRYWQFWVDGRYASVGADHAVLHDGAHVEWRFVVPAG